MVSEHEVALQSHCEEEGERGERRRGGGGEKKVHEVGRIIERENIK